MWHTDGNHWIAILFHLVRLTYCPVKYRSHYNKQSLTMQQVAKMALKCVSAVWCCGHWKPSRHYSYASKLANLNSVNTRSMHFKIKQLNKLTNTYIAKNPVWHVQTCSSIAGLHQSRIWNETRRFNDCIIVENFGYIPNSWLVKSSDR